MKKISLAAVALFCALYAGGCATQSDINTVAHYGGYATPQWDNWLSNLAPIAAVDFSPKRRVINDDDFAALFPALRNLNPRRVSLGGQNITDKSIDLLNQLPYLGSVNLEGTKVTYEGKGRLKLAHWE
jgi:hypothetical protein